MVTPTLARRCAWGAHWFSYADQVAAEQGAPITHGCCALHAVTLEAEIAALDGPAPLDQSIIDAHYPADKFDREYERARASGWAD